jgi:hypothetical protein
MITVMVPIIGLPPMPGALTQLPLDDGVAEHWMVTVPILVAKAVTTPKQPGCVESVMGLEYRLQGSDGGGVMAKVIEPALEDDPEPPDDGVDQAHEEQ